MNLKCKITIAKTAQDFLNRAIAEMENGKDDNKYDYDLWHAFKDLKSIQDDEMNNLLKLKGVNNVFDN